MNQHQTEQRIVEFIREHVGSKPAIIGLSGGLDSSTTAYLAVLALGKANVHAILSPSQSNTPDDIRLGKRVAENLGIAYEIVNIDTMTERFTSVTDLYTTKLSLGNLKARIRMNLLYGKANAIGGMVLGTGNKTELMIGYFTKYGDGGVDILPLGDIYKTDERMLAAYIGVPQEIIDRRPTAGLWDEQYDEDELGITYEKLDQILKAIEKNEDLSGFDQSDVMRVKVMIAESGHKRCIPPICNLKSEI